MKFLVTQSIEPDGSVLKEHLQPLAAVVADSMEEPPVGPVTWLGGCGNVATNEFHMLFEAPDQESMERCLEELPGRVTVERVMAVNRKTLGKALMRGVASDYERRLAEVARVNGGGESEGS